MEKADIERQLLRSSHNDQIERWAKFVRENPDKWKAIHTKFINSIFDKHYQFVERLKQSPGGEERLRKWKELRAKRIINR